MNVTPGKQRNPRQSQDTATLDLTAVKQFLRIDGDYEDAYLRILIMLSLEMCRNYLRTENLPDCESVKQAQLLIIGYFFENRDGDRDGVPSAVFSLLDPYRKAVF